MLKPVPEEETLVTCEGVTHTYAGIRTAMRLGDCDPFYMRLVGEDWDAFIEAVNQGIDSRLQACYVPDRGDVISSGREIRLSAESMPVLLCRFYEMGDEAAENLAESILDILFEKGDDDA